MVRHFFSAPTDLQSVAEGTVHQSRSTYMIDRQLVPLMIFTQTTSICREASSNTPPPFPMTRRYSGVVTGASHALHLQQQKNKQMY